MAEGTGVAKQSAVPCCLLLKESSVIGENYGLVEVSPEREIEEANGAPGAIPLLPEHSHSCRHHCSMFSSSSHPQGFCGVFF